MGKADSFAVRVVSTRFALEPAAVLHKRVSCLHSLHSQSVELPTFEESVRCAFRLLSYLKNLHKQTKNNTKHAFVRIYFQHRQFI